MWARPLRDPTVLIPPLLQAVLSESSSTAHGMGGAPALWATSGWTSALMAHSVSESLPSEGPHSSSSGEVDSEVATTPSSVGLYWGLSKMLEPVMVAGGPCVP